MTVAQVRSPHALGHTPSHVAHSPNSFSDVLACRNFGGYMVQTHRAHRLLLKAWQIGGHTLQQSLLESIYKNMFELRQNINDYDVLGGLAEANSVMSKDQVRCCVSSKYYLREITHTFPLA